MKKTPSHCTARVEIEWQISFFSFGFARVTEVRPYICNLLIWTTINIWPVVVNVLIPEVVINLHFYGDIYTKELQMNIFQKCMQYLKVKIQCILAIEMF